MRRPTLAIAQAVALAMALAVAAACAQLPPAAQGHGAPAGQAAPAQEAAVRQALADAQSRLGVPAAALHLVRVESVTWRDGSLGCPEPGLMYPQVLVPGYRITIESSGKSLDYHASQRGQSALCPPGQAVAPLDGPAAH